MPRERHSLSLGFSAIVVVLLTIPCATAAPYGLDSRMPVSPFLNNRLPPVLPEGQWAAAKAFPNLTFPYPMGFVQPPGATRFYVYCREGKIYYFESDPDTMEKTLFLDIGARTQGWDDCGLLGMAFHPAFGNAASTNRGFFYVFYQYSMTPTSGPERPPRTTPSYNRLSRFTVADGSMAADPDSELVLINQYDEDVWHNGGSMFFNPDDNFLYLTLGDEGGFDAQYGNTQVINKGLFSGVIRIDVDSDPARSHPIRRQPVTAGTQPPSQTAHYGIPNDNPFLDPAGSVLEEFWAIGLRSPHRMTYDPATRQIWLGDVGAARREEVNIIVKGGNYQWGYMEGTLQGPLARPATIIGTEQPPIYDYGRADGDITVIGGYVYRGATYAAELGGKYIFGDNGSGRIWALTTNASGPPTVTYLCNMPSGFGYGGLASFGVDHAGDLYMVQTGPAGTIYRLVRPTDFVPPPPALLSQTMVFTNMATMAPASGLIPFDVNSPLWSDGAIKTRWMALPNDGAPYSANEQIGYAPFGEWSFPNGTVFIKHFDLAIDEANPNLRRRLETRFLVRDTNGAAYGITYKWRADNSDADLLTGALNEEISIRTATPVGSFASDMNIGGGTPGTTLFDPATGRYTIVAGGADIWGDADQFRFVYQEHMGDFDVKARVESLTMVDLYTKAGVMARESLTAGSRHIFASVFGDNQQRGGNPTGYEVVYRPAAGGASQAIYPASTQPAVNYPNTWLRLKRAGNEFTAYGGNDGVTWTKYANVVLALPETVFFGMAVTAHDTTEQTTTRFLDFANNSGHAHYYPSPRDCITCHTPISKHILGVKTVQLNGDFTYAPGGATDNQLRTWNHLGLFNPPINESDIANLAKLVAVTNEAAPLEDRVRSYLAANCSQCHRPDGVPRANWDARYETPLSSQNIINGLVSEPLGVVGARVV
ncbi:MAG: PQQ-dependent sugar dehydrogenase, partial [Verrucomicrobia subdivision 3 bacterium]|nr:PQQ-dependent sugar dehydrogenase [Limisphaerales bacterium]